VEEDQIDIVRPETAKATLQFLMYTNGVAFIYFGGEVEFLAPSLQCMANLLLAVTVAVGCVNKVDSAIDGLIQEYLGFLLRNTREFDGSKANNGKFPACFSESSLLHTVFYFRSIGFRDR